MTFFNRDSKQKNRTKGEMRNSLHPSLKNLKFAQNHSSIIQKLFLFLSFSIVLLCFFEQTVTCSNIFTPYNSSQQIKLSIVSTGSLVNQLYFQPLILLQTIENLDFLFIFLNVHKNICLSAESIFLNGALWIATIAATVKLYLAANYLFKLIIHNLLFKTIGLNRYSTIGYKIDQFFYPEKNIKFNLSLIFILFAILSFAQIKIFVIGNFDTPQISQYKNIYLKNSSDLKKLDERVLSIKNEESKNIYTLSKALTDGLQTDLEKIYVIHKWVTTNISYDAKTYFAKDVKNTTLYGYNTSDLGHANAALEKRLAVCDGYSELILQLGLASNLRVEKISGYVNDSYFGKKKEDTYHAWNAVKIDGTWYLMDATWDAGSVGENKLFTKNVGDYSYFLIDPGLFKKTHTPVLKKWLLTKY